jgi:phosphoenolpyruvate carboxykinase (ATP)
MQDVTISQKDKKLKEYGLIGVKSHWNLSPQALQQVTLQKGMGRENSNGVLAVNTGTFTGRSPQDRYLVKDDYTSDKVWWGKINKPISSEKFDLLYNEITNYLSGKELYVRDAYVCADPDYRTNIRTITELPWSNLFAYNMFLRADASALENFCEDWLVLCAPGYNADPQVHGTRQKNCACWGFCIYRRNQKRDIFCFEFDFALRKKCFTNALFGKCW